MRDLIRKPVTWVLLGVLGVGVAFGLWLFQPWKLFIDQTVDEALPDVPAATASGSPAPASGSPTADPDTGPAVLAEGEFVTHEHATTGTARLVRLADGSRVLSIEDLNTSNGPDLRVWLTDQKVSTGSDAWFVFDDGKYVELGRLKGNKGNQVYKIADSVDLDDYRSVTIWCKRFSVSFGAAELTSA